MTRNTRPQTPIWCGIHYLLYLRHPGEQEDCARFSLFQTEYSPAGSGHAAFLYLEDASLTATPENAVYTDNPELAEWLYNRMYRNSDNPLSDCGEPVLTARFGRSGDMRRGLSCSIDTAHHHIAATWDGLEPPFVHHGQAANSSLYTYCFFVVAPHASLTVDGEELSGAIYDRQDWVPLVGRPLSSCLIADEFWAEL